MINYGGVVKGAMGIGVKLRVAVLWVHFPNTHSVMYN
jgi:hypothetical protein